MFLSAHSFQNLSPSWAQLLNLMGSLMPIFKKIHPIPSSAVPSGRSAAPNVASSQNICHSYSLSRWGVLCTLCWSCSDDFSYLKPHLHLQTTALCHLQALTPDIILMWFSLTLSVYLNLTYFLWPRISPICLIADFFWLLLLTLTFLFSSSIVYTIQLHSLTRAYFVIILHAFFFLQNIISLLKVRVILYITLYFSYP